MIKVTDGKTPKVEDDSILIQERYDAIPTPNGQKQTGAYYSWKGKWLDLWDKFVSRAQSLIEANLAKYVPTSRTITINGDTKDLSSDRDWTVSGGTVTSVAALTLGTTGTDLSSTVTNSTTTPVITLNVPTASATNRGVLSSTDWSTFNGKQNTLTAANFGSFINGLTAKTTPVDADGVALMDSADSSNAKFLSWANIKATLKTYFDTLYLTSSNGAYLVSSATASSSATIDFTLPNGYKSFELRCIGVIPVTDNVGFWVRVSTDGGSTFAAGASDYAYQRSFQSGITPVQTLTTADSKIFLLGTSIGNGTGRYFNAIVRVWNNESSSQYKNITGSLTHTEAIVFTRLGL